MIRRKSMFGRLGDAITLWHRCHVNPRLACHAIGCMRDAGELCLHTSDRWTVKRLCRCAIHAPSWHHASRGKTFCWPLRCGSLQDRKDRQIKALDDFITVLSSNITWSLFTCVIRIISARGLIALEVIYKNESIVCEKIWRLQRSEHAWKHALCAPFIVYLYQVEYKYMGISLEQVRINVNACSRYTTRLYSKVACSLQLSHVDHG